MKVRELLEEILTLLEAGCGDEEVVRVNKNSIVIYVAPEKK